MVSPVQGQGTPRHLRAELQIRLKRVQLGFTGLQRSCLPWCQAGWTVLRGPGNNVHREVSNWWPSVLNLLQEGVCWVCCLPWGAAGYCTPKELSAPRSLSGGQAGARKKNSFPSAVSLQFPPLTKLVKEKLFKGPRSIFTQPSK